MLVEIEDFEWDNNKKDVNFRKHEIDFIDAIEVFNDPFRIEVEILRNGEQRYQTIGIINEVAILVVYTQRDGKKRIISARKASKNERGVYYNLGAGDERKN